MEEAGKQMKKYNESIKENLLDDNEASIVFDPPSIFSDLSEDSPYDDEASVKFDAAPPSDDDAPSRADMLGLLDSAHRANMKENILELPTFKVEKQFDHVCICSIDRVKCCFYLCKCFTCRIRCCPENTPVPLMTSGLPDNTIDVSIDFLQNRKLPQSVEDDISKFVRTWYEAHPKISIYWIPEEMQIFIYMSSVSFVMKYLYSVVGYSELNCRRMVNVKNIHTIDNEVARKAKSYVKAWYQENPQCHVGAPLSKKNELKIYITTVILFLTILSGAKTEVDDMEVSLELRVNEQTYRELRDGRGDHSTPNILGHKDGLRSSIWNWEKKLRSKILVVVFDILFETISINLLGVNFSFNSTHVGKSQ